MGPRTHLRSQAYWVVVGGLLLAAASAVVPFHTTGYRLQYGVLLAGIMPYLVYGIAAPLLERTPVIIAGLILLAAHLWLVVGERFADAADYSDGKIYYVPLLLALALLPLLFRVLRKPY